MRYLLLLIFSLFSLSLFADSFPDEPYVSVVGNASLEIEADQVVIQFQSSSLNENGQLAKQVVDQRIESVLTNLHKSNFNTELLETISQSTRPEYEYQNKQRTLLGIRVTHQLSYRLTDITLVNHFLEALLDAQIESISALQYSLQDPYKWQSKVRAMAVLDSKQKASDLAHLYDMKLGKVYSINYTNNSTRPMLARAMSMESDSSKIKPKNITLSDRVNTIFRLNSE